jgi:hypothetical protein
MSYLKREENKMRCAIKYKNKQTGEIGKEKPACYTKKQNFDFSIDGSVVTGSFEFVFHCFGTGIRDGKPLYNSNKIEIME